MEYVPLLRLNVNALELTQRGWSVMLCTYKRYSTLVIC
jgi:hypothetical protein